MQGLIRNSQAAQGISKVNSYFNVTLLVAISSPLPLPLNVTLLIFTSSSTFFIAPVLAIAAAVNAGINDRPTIEYFISSSTDIDIAVKSSRQ